MIPLLVLRPQPGAAATAARARRLGMHPMVSPLFAIRPIEPAPWGDPPDAVLLTSANAARALGGWARPLLGVPAYAVGAATAAAATAAGFARVVAGDGDAAAIVALAAGQGVRRMLHLAGREHHAAADPRVMIERRICYAADAVACLPAAAVEACRAGAVALLHSPRAAGLFARLVDGAGVPRGGVGVAALSPAIAAAAGSGWRAVACAARITDAALLAAAAELCDWTPLEDGNG